MSTSGQQSTSMHAGQTDFDPAALLRYLETDLHELPASIDARNLSIEPISGGQSNPTYFVTIGDRELVLRKAPNGELLPGAHRVDREYRIMAALADSGVPVPAMVRLEEDKSVLGAPFYLMERLHGQVFHESTLPDHSPEARSAIYEHKARVLANLHCVDIAEKGLEDYGRTGPFFTRQIHRWTQQWELSKTREIPEIDQLAKWLKENDDGDETSTLVHGDYRIGNLMLHPGKPRIVGVLDWELSTLGHPLADLAHATAMWHITPEEYGGLMGADLKALGIPDRQQFEETYLEAAGFSNGLTTFHHAFALFRWAVIFQGIAKRAESGNAASENAATVGALAIALGRRGAELLSVDRLTS
ncbi:Predicted kinase, aminoglycoside phosphotransferase (APT) family [Marinobacter daqiaonensis]|uniref:Predicted kinase, aminoglycoside phosphotransferase (APT) family n=1 Tax=Marinobacter daqiaonensis TaxID=650891 RepID=A0A1I6IMH1_9GAMM|nr:phosphotransferase family protein [Marinobacter daqiaonensis]SFR67922.1 Predicted kinase, aminoglycoside phosphotransferase (APT) family [Marinobacter daqiaonensis]